MTLVSTDQLLETAVDALVKGYQAEVEKTSLDTLQERRQRFLEMYSKEHLRAARGQALLTIVHGPAVSSKQGLLYELEWGLGEIFGAVWGGSALKYKVHRRKEDGEWMRTGSHNTREVCTVDEAIRITEGLVDALWHGLLQADECLLTTGERERWLAFQSKHTGTILELGWAHKYLAICRPDLFSFHHNVTQIRGHLLHFGLVPVQGRWMVDWQWRSLRLAHPKLRELDPYLLARAAYSHWKHLTQYWRIAIDSEAQWESLRSAGQLGVGGPVTDDLSEILQGLTADDAKPRLAEILNEEPDGAGYVPIYHDFLYGMREGDRILATLGRKCLGVGTLSGAYRHQSGSDMCHHRDAEWRDATIGDLSSSPIRLLAEFGSRVTDAALVERALSLSSAYPEDVAPTPVATAPLSEETLAIRNVLERKGQCIVYGPPGTGKTYHTRLAARDLVTAEIFPGRAWASLTESEKATVNARNVFCTFHPAFSYEDFVEGFKPEITENGAPGFRLQDGVFKQACTLAQDLPSTQHAIIIIDEINRGNVASVMGELITLLELDKRDNLYVRLPYSKTDLTVPSTLWIIGTMNTADRSISLLDTALRRRFGFVELMPRPERLDTSIDGLPLKALLSYLNLKIRRHLGHEARERQIGHAYFMSGPKSIETLEQLHQVMRYDVLPLLAEYCYDSYDTLREILGDSIVQPEVSELNPDVVGSPDNLFKALMELISTESSLFAELPSQTPEEEGPET